ncbi:Zinc finger matrin-type protein 4 [Triplophysa tibetana]|uniref:Zinc finger matrin-type protein 4 n=1 Tax=Triplophysa tibetana TaxID=1572043 RepID=A0A5A9N3Q8_9TELE|nr:Zinc finger matrin-type protein 4 [Triplophysa tibetana]
MKSTEVDAGLFTDSYCRVCSAQLISESQRVAHYESRKHANKVRLYHMLHPADGGCPAKKLRTDNVSSLKLKQIHLFCMKVSHVERRRRTRLQKKIITNSKRLSFLKIEADSFITALRSPDVAIREKTTYVNSGSSEGDVDKNKCCTLCNMSFTSAVVAQSHYQGKIHAKRLRLLLGEPPAIISKEVTSRSEHMVTEVSSGCPSRQGRLSHRYCQMCKAWFNNPGMARQHYDGKKHKKNAAQANLLAQLGKNLENGEELNGLKRSHTCEVCHVTLNSVAQYHAHLQGSKHQNK